MVEPTESKMVFRYLGNTGIRVSVLSYGNMLAEETEEGYNFMRDSIRKSLEGGINFYDNAEVYGNGICEKLMGRAFQELKTPREKIVLATKVFRCGFGENDTFLSRKHIIEGLNNSLKRLQTDYVDVYFCHRPDYDTPLEETCRAMNTVINQGKVHYWATSEWNAERIMEAVLICDKYGLHKPIADQVEYNMITRDKFEKEYRRLFQLNKMGSTIWSPLAGGILAGRYNDGKIPEDGRYSDSSPMQDFFKKMMWNKYFHPSKIEETQAKLRALGDYAKELGYTQAQLALAWSIASTDTSTCILGFSKLEQVDQNLQAIELMKKWTPEIEAKCESILSNTPYPDFNFRGFSLIPSRRSEVIKY